MTHPLLPAGAGLINDPPLEVRPDRPLVSMLLIAYQQPDTIARAIRGALAQTYSPLEIVEILKSERRRRFVCQHQGGVCPVQRVTLVTSSA